ncbi:MAG TPA: hypothetical protein VFH28_03530 [Nitrososphaera sp.]|nr:hypothetical protein [Nitrososphaera sp.]
MSETPIPLVKQQLQYHLEQTFVQQDRLRTIITNLGGSPTSAKAALPMMLPTDMDTLSNTFKETAKSLVSSKSKDRVDAEIASSDDNSPKRSKSSIRAPKTN